MAHDRTSVTLAFHDRCDGKPVHLDLSAVVRVGNDLWIGTDEGATIERLSPDGHGFGRHASFHLAEYLALPDDADREIDIEGLDYADGYLWVVGSHSARRKAPDPEVGGTKKRLRRLARVARRGNRYLLARVPLAPTDDGASYEPASFYVDPERADRTRHAARLRGGRSRNDLLDALEDDPHLAPFLDLPGKDNGFNVEGFAVDGGRVYLGLRGPVIEGRAIVLAITVEEHPRKPDTLRLARAGPKGRPYEKHFLDLRGLGVRELCIDGRDLLVLAGPTMRLDGRATVYRWRGGADVRGDSFVERDDLEKVLDLPYGEGEEEGVDHPEGVALLSDGRGEKSLLVVYDSPSEQRRRGDRSVEADVFPLK